MTCARWLGCDETGRANQGSLLVSILGQNPAPAIGRESIRLLPLSIKTLIYRICWGRAEVFAGRNNIRCIFRVVRPAMAISLAGVYLTRVPRHTITENNPIGTAFPV